MTKDQMRSIEEALDFALEALQYIHEGANNQGPHTGISWRCVAVKAEPAIKAIKQARALDKKADNAMIYKTFEQWMNGDFLEVGEPRKKAYSKDELLLVEMGWNYGYDAGRAVEQALDKKADNARELGLDYEPVQEPDRTGMTYYKNDKCKAASAHAPDCICWTPAAQPAPDLQAELEATNRQVEILSDALAESRREVARLKAQPAPAPVHEPEIVQRVKRYAGQTLRTARNPNITARECIELANWLAANTTPPHPQHLCRRNKMKKYEYCCQCGEATGRAGAGEDSLYTEHAGPFCEDCYPKATPPAAPVQEPLFWYKPYPNGMYNGPVHNAQIGDVLRGSEEWRPLYTTPPAAQRQWVDMPELELLGAYEEEQRGRFGDHVRGLLNVQAKLKEKNT